MTAPGPDRATLESILTTAARVPDHRKLTPWRFIVIEGDTRERLGRELRTRHASLHPGLPADRHDFEAGRFFRAPTIVAVVSSPKDCPKGTPEWEQALSAGAVCLKMCMAAQARGFGAQWLTEWYAYDAPFLQVLGLTDGERIAGFIYLGTVTEPSRERPRPDLEDKVTYA